MTARELPVVEWPRLTVREAASDDREPCLLLLQEFVRSRGEKLTVGALTMAQTVDLMLSGIGGKIFVADDGAGVVGVLVLALHTHPLSREMAASEVAWYLQPDARGHGIELLRLAERWAVAQGCARLSLIAPTVQTGRVYQRLGFHPMEQVYHRPLASGVTLRRACPDDGPLLWQWLNEEPRSNLMDDSPGSLIAWQQHFNGRLYTEMIQIACLDGVPVGAIGVECAGRVATLRGIVFTRNACGHGIARHAVEQVLDQLREAGVEKVQAFFLSHNARVQRFLLKLGFITEGVFEKQVMQQGAPVDVTAMARQRG